MTDPCSSCHEATEEVCPVTTEGCTVCQRFYLALHKIHLREITLCGALEATKDVLATCPNLPMSVSDDDPFIKVWVPWTNEGAAALKIAREALETKK